MSSGIWPLVSIILGILLSLGCLVGAFYILRKKRLIDDVPTSKAQGVFIGLVELKGTAESEMPLSSNLAGIQCVQYSWQVDEHWSRVVTQTHTDSKGNTHTTTRTESGWTKVAGGSQSIPFYLKDDTGIIRILSEGANITSLKVFNKTCSPDNELYYRKGPARGIPNSTHKRRFSETALPLHTTLYIMGQAREREDIVAPEIAFNNKAPMFVISTRTEKQLSNRYALWYWVWIILGLLAGVGGSAAWSLLEKTSIMWQPPVIAGIGFIFVLLLGWTWAVYNSLINLHHMVERSWSQVDVQLKRRHDLIPNLVQAIEGYRTFESETQKLMAEIRAQTQATPPSITGPDFKGLAPMLKIIVERYPELKANESFLKLQRSLIDTEERIALARDYYNNIVTFYNTRLSIIPDRFVAAITRFHPRTLMAAADFERSPVQVHLAS
jgi:hypothetical protein